MSSVEVTAVVASIVSAFASGLDIFRRMKAKQGPKRSKKRSKKFGDEEYRLEHSLQTRPKEIRAKYDGNLARLGDCFAVGDSTAQTSLNHTLLLLNTGLIQILSYALSNDTEAQALSRRSLLNLSETAAADAVRALDQLQDRLSSTSQLKLMAPPSAKKKIQRRDDDVSTVTVGSNKARPVLKPRAKSFSSTERKCPGPDPLVRGAWVRSKSGTSIITVSSSSSGIPATKAFDVNLRAASASLIPHIPTVPRLPHHRTTSSPSYSARPEHDGVVRRSRKNSVSSLGSPPPSYVASPESKKHQCPNRQPSLLIASAEVFKDPQVPPFLSRPPPSQPPPPPPKLPFQTSIPDHKIRPSLPPPPPPPPPHPVPSVPVPGSAMRHRPPSVATFLTASTKIGEIPEHKWLDHHPSNTSNVLDPARPSLPCTELQSQNQLPYIIPPRLEEDTLPKRKGRGFRFWKRNEQVVIS